MEQNEDYVARRKNESLEEYAAFEAHIAEWFALEKRFDYNFEVKVKSEVDLAEGLLSAGDEDLISICAMWHFDDAKLLDLFTRIACPIVCKGYSTPPENWHELCEAKAQQALDILRGRR